MADSPSHRMRLSLLVTAHLPTPVCHLRLPPPHRRRTVPATGVDDIPAANAAHSPPASVFPEHVEAIPMQQHSEKSRSVWMDTAPQAAPQGLTQDTRADVCVVGAGIAG